MSEREEFEAAWSRLVGLPYNQALQRGVWDLDFMWDLWQAARSPSVEPPPTESARRSTWRTHGMTCENCGHVLSKHEGQVFCPPTKRGEK